jgi:Fe-S cluster biogenesis protein NfuA
MLRLLDHRHQPRKVRDSGSVGVSEFHAASVDMIGGACHGGDVDLV